jgi:hypothetical protein
MSKLYPLLNSFILVHSVLICLVLQQKVWAHHTKDHLMLQADPQQVIAGTQQGVVFSWSWMIWFLVFFLIVIGIIRQWKK